jgi:lipopolysaccharide transport system permease protein
MPRGLPKNSDRQIHPQEIVIKPPSNALNFNFKELYKYRYLIWNFVWRDIRLQFDEMYLGAIWATARPLLMVTLFSLFRDLSGANLYVQIPYATYVYSGLILWFYFIEATSATSKSIQTNAGLITKIYFPRIITSIVPAIASLYGLGVAMLPLFCMMVWQGVYPGWRVIILPAVLFQCMLLVLGVGTIFAVLSLQSKDFDKLLSQIFYIGLYISPVIFAPELIPAKARLIYFLNPMAGTLLAFRSCLFDDFSFPVWQWMYSIAATFLLVSIGLVIYQKVEAFLVDKL